MIGYVNVLSIPSGETMPGPVGQCPEGQHLCILASLLFGKPHLESQKPSSIAFFPQSLLQCKSKTKSASFSGIFFFNIESLLTVKGSETTKQTSKNPSTITWNNLLHRALQLSGTEQIFSLVPPLPLLSPTHLRAAHF